MIGAIIGDIAGTKYEYQEFIDSKKGVINLKRRKSILDLNNESLISKEGFISDDSILTTAIAEAIIYKADYGEVLKKYGKEYGNTPLNREGFFKSAFSPTFIKWANSEKVESGNSQGNGAAMRVSPVAYLFNDIEKVEIEAKKTAIPSHNSKQAIKGAQSLASAIFLARQGQNKSEIKKYIVEKYGYNLEYDLGKLQETNLFDGSCDITVPQAIFVFLESCNFEDSIRKAISIGGDTDTIACMVGAISEAYYGIPKKLINQALEILPAKLRNVIIQAYIVKRKNEEKGIYNLERSE